MYLAWYVSEFAAANAIIDALCGHLVQVSDGGISDCQAVLGAIHRRRQHWIPVLQMQTYHSIAEVVVELQKLAEKKIGKVTSEKNEDDQEVKEVDKKAEEESLDEKESVGENVIQSSEDDHAGKESLLEDNEKESVGENVIQSSEDDHAGKESLLEDNEKKSVGENVIQSSEDDHAETALENNESANGENTDSGSDRMQPLQLGNGLCTNHEDCEARPAQIKLTKGFSARELAKGVMVNAVKGLRLYENVFTDSELSKLNELVDALRVAGQNGELLGDTFVLFNQQVKDYRRELVQLGVPIFSQIREDATVNIEPIPVLLLAVIDHLVQWGLISRYKKPNGCIINFFEEEEHSQPFQKPPHLDEPLVTLFLSETTMVFGRTLEGDNNGNYNGPLMLCLRKGSLLVMRGKSANMAQQCVCPSPEKKVTVIFFRVRHAANQCQHGSTSPPTASAMTLWQPDVPSSYGLPNASLFGYGAGAMDVMPELGFPCQPVLTLDPMVFGPSIRLPGGTGDFLPWTVGSRKHTKYLRALARARRGWLLALASTAESNATEPEPEPEP